MEQITDIQNELKQLSPLLAGLDKSHLYTIPHGYFEQFPENMLSLVKSYGILDQINKSQNDDVPEGYFDSLADNILSRIKLQAQSEPEEELSVLLKSAQKVNPYQVPVGYFETLSTEITAGLSESAADELKIISPLVAGISRENLFDVPVGYFDSLSNEIISKLDVQPVKVISIRKRTNIFKYAAAAAVTAVLIFTGIKIMPSKSGGDTTPPIASLTAVQKKGIDLSRDSVKMEAEFADVSDAAIVKYLQNSGEDVNAALVASMDDEKNLPNSEDYLIDDKTLDNLLDNIQAN